MTDTTPIRRPVRAVARRMRLSRAIDAAAVMALAGLGAAGLIVGMIKAGALPAAEAWGWLAAAAALPVLGALVGAARPLGRLAPAQRLDRHHRLHSRIASALELSQLPADERTPFVEAAIEDAVAHARVLDPRRAAPIRAPRDLVAVVGLALGVTALAFLEVPERAIVPVTAELDPLLLHADDIDAFRSGLDDLVNDPDTDDDVREAARAFNQLVEDLADRRLDRTEALRRVSQLEERLMTGRNLDDESLRDALRELGDELRRSSLTEAASEALRDGDAARAERAVRELANQLRDDPPSRAELERLRQALERAAQQDQRSAEDLQREIEQQREQMNRLLQREREKNGLSERERRLLERRRRELEHLERQQQRQAEQQRQLERLRREMQQAAEDLRREMNEQAADSMDRGAEDLNRMAQQQMSEEQMRQLTEQLRQLREMLRRQRQQQANNGQGQGQQQGNQGQGQGRMDRFVLRARGQGDGEGVPLLMPGGQQGQAGQGGQGNQGGNQQGQGQQALMPGGQGNAQLEIPGMGQGPGQGQQQGGGQAGVGPGAGTGHDGQMLDDPTRIDSTRQNIRVQGEDSQGPTRSEVILSASDRGFASRPYRDVYTDYSGHAEEVLETDEIPPGYRFYVRRYFQLIRPRDDGAAGGAGTPPDARGNDE